MAVRGPTVTVYRAPFIPLTEACAQGWNPDNEQDLPASLADLEALLRSPDDIPRYSALMRMTDDILLANRPAKLFTLEEAYAMCDHGVPTILMPSINRLRAEQAYTIGRLWGYGGEPLLGQGDVSCPLGDFAPKPWPEFPSPFLLVDVPEEAYGEDQRRAYTEAEGSTPDNPARVCLVWAWNEKLIQKVGRLSTVMEDRAGPILTAHSYAADL